MTKGEKISKALKIRYANGFSKEHKLSLSSSHTGYIWTSAQIKKRTSSRQKNGWWKDAEKVKLSRTGKNSPSWKGLRVGYQLLHAWLREKYGNPKECEQCGKIGTSNNSKWTIQWALKKGRKYLRRRDNFMQLCRSCHARYDDVRVVRQIKSEIAMKKLSKKQHA